MSRSARLVLAATSAAAVLACSACASLPEPVAADQVGDQAGDVLPVVVAEQALRAETAVAERVAAAAVDPALAPGGLTGPALDLATARAVVGGPAAEQVVRDVAPPDILVAPRLTGWPRWFATVETPEGSGSGSGSGTDGADDAGDDGGEAAVPVLRLYEAAAPREPYRLWAEMTLVPGAVVPAFDAAASGAPVLEQQPGESTAGSDDPTDSAPAAEDGGTIDGDSDEASAADLPQAVADLAERYAGVLADGAASELAAQFEPDPYVPAVRARAEAETAAVAEVADLSVTQVPYDDGRQFVALTADGDALVVTAVTTTTTAAVRPGQGTLRPGAELAALAGVDEADTSLTSTSVAVLAFLVPAERGAIRLVALGEGLVSAEAG